MKSQPNIDMPYGKMEKFFHLLALLFMVASFIYGAIAFPSLPEKVPIHFNAAGEADNWGSKYFIFGLPLIHIPSFLLLYFLGKSPHTHNYPIKITEENAEKVYKESQRMMSLLNVAISLIFSIIMIEMVFSAQGKPTFGAWIIMVTFVFPLVLVIVSFMRIYRLK